LDSRNYIHSHGIVHRATWQQLAGQRSPFSVDQIDQNPDSLAIELQAPDLEELEAFEELGRTSS